MIHNIIRKPPCELNFFAFAKQTNLGRRFGTSKMRLSSPVALMLLSVLRQCSYIVDSLFIGAHFVCVGYLFGHCFVMQFLVSFPVLQLS